MSSQYRLRDLLRASRDASSLSVRAIADKAGLSHGTISNYLAGKEPRSIPDETLDALSRGFGIPFPRLQAAALADRGLSAAESSKPTKAPDDSVIAAILADPDLLPEAKTHLVNQYGLLLRIQAAAIEQTPAEQREATTRAMLSDVASSPASLAGRRAAKKSKIAKAPNVRTDR